MKKFLLLLLLAALPCFAGPLMKNTILSGQQTNSAIYWGTNQVIVLNTIFVTNTFDNGKLTNLGVIVRNNPINLNSTSIRVGISGFTVGNQSNFTVYSFQVACDTNNWIDYTNVEFRPNLSVPTTYTNFAFTVGDWQYFRCYNISNSNVGSPALGLRSNLLEVYQK